MLLTSKRHFTVFKHFVSHNKSKTAIIDDLGSYTYEDIDIASEHIAHSLSQRPMTKLHNRVGILTHPDFSFIVSQVACAKIQAAMVPISVKATSDEIGYQLNDCEASSMICHTDYMEKLENIKGIDNLNLLPINDKSIRMMLEDRKSAKVEGIEHKFDEALVIYTSGTTGKPKGALHTHDSVRSQLISLSEAWGWTSDDHIYNVLPLHHVHGLINVVGSALYNGASVEMARKFHPQETWDRLLNDQKLTVFMAVPSVYFTLLKYYNENMQKDKTVKSKLKRLRLMISGSAALPEPIFHQWKELSGHHLLERFGMTEFGMGLGNPLYGERVPGTVGFTFPGVEARLDRREGDAEGTGELQIRTPQLFKGYLNRPETTSESFTTDGFFRTGDFASVDDKGVYRILGRLSQDIIKKSGYKIGALEIENIILEVPAVAEVAVIGRPCDKHGEDLAAFIVLNKGQ